MAAQHGGKGAFSLHSLPAVAQSPPRLLRAVEGRDVLVGQVKRRPRLRVQLRLRQLLLAGKGGNQSGGWGGITEDAQDHRGHAQAAAAWGADGNCAAAWGADGNCASCEAMHGCHLPGATLPARPLRLPCRLRLTPMGVHTACSATRSNLAV